MAVSFTQGNDFIVPTEDGQTYLGGAGNDTYMLSDATVAANSTIVIQDTEGTNTIQLVGGLSIASSMVTSNALELTLSNGAKVQILGADSFGYDVGGNALAGVDGTDQTFTELVENTLGTTVPATGEAPSTGGTVEVPDATAPATPTFSVAASADEVIEGNTATFTVSLSEAQSAATTVDYAVALGGGAAAADHGDITVDGTVDNAGSGTLTFTAGEVSKTITVPIAFDTETETGETIGVTLSNAPTGFDLGTASDSVTLVDPPAPTFTITSDAVSGAATEEGQTITYTITPSSITDKAYTFTLSTLGDTLGGVTTAAAAADFSPASQTITFAAGQTTAETVTQTIVNDGSTEGLEGYKTQLLDSSFAVVGDAITGLITDPTSGTGSGTTYNLTTSADNLTGTNGNDTFVGEVNAGTATSNTIGAADQLDGGAGTGDTFQITISDISGPSNLAAVQTTAIEAISVRNVDVTPDAITVNGVNFTGATEFLSDRSTGAIIFNNIGTADLTIKGNDAVTNGNVTFTAGAASVTDPLVINVKDGVNAGVISNAADVNGDWTSVTINSTGGTPTATTNANVLTSMDVAGGNTMQNLTINATSSLTTGVVAGWDTTGATTANKGMVTITGAGAVNIGALDAAVEDVVATSNSGGATFTASTQTDFTFAGSSGDDRVTTNAVLGTDGLIDAGTGTGDRLILGASGHVTLTVGEFYKGFEELQVANGVTVDMDHLATNNTISSVRLTTGGVVNDMNATQAANVTVTTGGNSPTLAVKGAATVGQIDTVHITADDGVSTTSTIALATPVLADIEKLHLTANDNITVAALTGAGAFDSLVLDGAGTINITAGAITPNANTVIDGSAATGVLTIDMGGIVGALTTNPMSIIGGSAGDTITAGGGAADLVNGKGGIDSITVTKDVANSGFADVQSDAVASADADLITGFVTTENDFDYNGALINGTGAGAGIESTEVASALNIAAALATGDAGNDIVFIATTDLTGAQETALDAAVLGGMTAAEATAVEAALVATGGALNGAIANLDTVLGTSDSALFQFSTDTDTMVLRVTNTDTSTANTLTANEIELVGVFAATADLVAGDYV